MRYHFTLTMRSTDGGLKRATLAAKEMGFLLVGMVGNTRLDGGRWQLHMTGEDADPRSLQAALDTFADCLAVEMTPCP